MNPHMATTEAAPLAQGPRARVRWKGLRNSGCAMRRRGAANILARRATDRSVPGFPAPIGLKSRFGLGGAEPDGSFRANIAVA
jgi:hypothetical protein